MVTTALSLWVAAGLALALVSARCLRGLFTCNAPDIRGPLPPVSILKPLRGLDADLERNLETFFTLDYPTYEILFGVEDPADPALAVAREVAARHPRIPVEFVADGSRVGLNPKVNNLANIVPYALYETILISDSNIAVRPGYLRDLAARLTPGVGLVSSVFRGVGAGLGGAIEALQINTFVAPGMSAVHLLFAAPCVVGKSMLMRRADLEAIGGFEFLSRFLAEDQVCGEELSARGHRLALSGETIDNVLGPRSVRDFVDRHLRWARIRYRINPAAYIAELLLNPVFASLVGVAILATPASLCIAGATLVAMSALAASVERSLGIRRPFMAYPGLELLRSLLTGLAWFVPFVRCTTMWRGHVLRIGRRTELVERPASSLPWPVVVR